MEIQAQLRQIFPIAAWDPRSFRIENSFRGTFQYILLLDLYRSILAIEQ